ncbi:MAG: hypothetical protein RLZZ303_3442 [Candidatus Hydrogenedentota bacterium]
MRLPALTLCLILATGGLALALPPAGPELVGVAGEPAPRLVKSEPVLDKRPIPVAVPGLLSPRPDTDSPPASLSLPPLLERMAGSEDAALRQRSVEGIAALSNPVAETHLLRLSIDSDQGVRHAASSQLSGMDAASLARRLLDLLSAPDGPLANGGMVSLDGLAPLLGAEMLVLFSDTALDPALRSLAAWCLGQMRYADAYQPLRDTLWSDQTELAYACLDALYWLDDPRSAEDWIELAGYADPWAQSYAAAAMARTPSESNLEALYQLASGQSGAPPDAQARALEGLSLFSPEVAVPRLIMILRTNLPMREDVMAALRRNTGYNAGRYPDNWFEWYRGEQDAGGAFAPQDAAQESAPPLMPADGGGNTLLNTVDFVPPDFQP